MPNSASSEANVTIQNNTVIRARPPVNRAVNLPATVAPVGSGAGPGWGRCCSARPTAGRCGAEYSNTSAAIDGTTRRPRTRPAPTSPERRHAGRDRTQDHRQREDGDAGQHQPPATDDVGEQPHDHRPHQHPDRGQTAAGRPGAPSAPGRNRRTSSAGRRRRRPRRSRRPSYTRGRSTTRAVAFGWARAWRRCSHAGGPTRGIQTTAGARMRAIFPKSAASGAPSTRSTPGG
jgi:hypothetical protein